MPKKRKSVSKKEEEGTSEGQTGLFTRRQRRPTSSLEKDEKPKKKASSDASESTGASTG